MLKRRFHTIRSKRRTPSGNSTHSAVADENNQVMDVSSETGSLRTPLEASVTTFTPTEEQYDRIMREVGQKRKKKSKTVLELPPFKVWLYNACESPMPFAEFRKILDMDMDALTRVPANPNPQLDQIIRKAITSYFEDSVILKEFVEERGGFQSLAALNERLKALDSGIVTNYLDDTFQSLADMSVHELDKRIRILQMFAPGCMPNPTYLVFLAAKKRGLLTNLQKALHFRYPPSTNFLELPYPSVRTIYKYVKDEDAEAGGRAKREHVIAGSTSSVPMIAPPPPDYSKSICDYCQQLGHIKKDCQVYEHDVREFELTRRQRALVPAQTTTTPDQISESIDGKMLFYLSLFALFTLSIYAAHASAW